MEKNWTSDTLVAFPLTNAGFLLALGGGFLHGPNEKSVFNVLRLRFAPHLFESEELLGRRGSIV